MKSSTRCPDGTTTSRTDRMRRGTGDPLLSTGIGSGLALLATLAEYAHR